MKFSLVAIALAVMLGACAQTDWRHTAQESLRSACRGADNCSMDCDRKNPATLTDPKCVAPSGRRVSQ